MPRWYEPPWGRRFKLPPPAGLDSPDAARVAGRWRVLGTLVSSPCSDGKAGSSSREIRTNVDALLGRVGVVSERIDPASGRGRIVVEGEDWRAASLMDTALEQGARVIVVRVEGTTLFVDKEM